MRDKNKGIYPKFYVEKIDGDPHNKHKGCRYFVLDMNHDEFAKPALLEYAKKCREKGYIQLANDIESVFAI